MSEEFHDWLDKCPVRWSRYDDDGNGTATYCFYEEHEGSE
jgi:hypothetical protein